MTDILLLTFDRKELLQKTLESIWERTRTPYRLIVIDNGSTDGTVEYLKSIEDKVYKLVLLKENIGICPAYNEGFKLVESEYFVTTQDDLLPPDLEPDWLIQMIDLFKRHPKYGGIAMRTCRMIKVDFDEESELGHGKHSCCAYFRIQRKSDILKSSNWFSNKKWNEDNAFHNVILELGLKTGFATNIWTNHIGHSQYPNKGYGSSTTYMGYNEQKNKEKQRKPYPEVDNKTNMPICTKNQ